MKKYRIRVLTALACVLMAASVSWAAAIAIVNTQALAFGKFVAGSGGSVTVSPGGVRSASGGVVLVPSGPGAAAQFSVTGDPSVIYSITLPANGVVSLTSGGNSMALNNFTSTPSASTPSTGLLSAGGSQTLSVGATLSVGSNQASGSYSGTFDVTVNYN
ncbi:MAG: DUF4402 domain-containing protein [Polaromonas sp.]|nr:DUF4402 domain-containing protein [Polaromonas sp.]